MLKMGLVYFAVEICSPPVVPVIVKAVAAVSDLDVSVYFLDLLKLGQQAASGLQS